MIRIVTDTASDMTCSEAQQLNVSLISLPVTFIDAEYNQETDENYNVFYDLLEQSKELPKTSRATPSQYLDIFQDAKQKNESVIVITLSSGLSGTIEVATAAKNMIEYNKISIVDSRQATLSQRMLVNYAVKMRDQGKDLNYITEQLIQVRDKITVFGLVDKLTYLKKGGRIPPALALIGNALSIKPIIILNNSKLEHLAKVRGFNKGKEIVINELEKQQIDFNHPIYFGYTKNRETGLRFMHETTNKLSLPNTSIYPIGCVIGTHLGPGCIAVSFIKK